jgi:hypothetical protein
MKNEPHTRRSRQLRFCGLISPPFIHSTALPPHPRVVILTLVSFDHRCASPHIAAFRWWCDRCTFRLQLHFSFIHFLIFSVKLASFTALLCVVCCVCVFFGNPSVHPVLFRMSHLTSLVRCTVSSQVAILTRISSDCRFVLRTFCNPIVMRWMHVAVSGTIWM